MASTSSTGLKRPHPEDNTLGDSAKRSRSNNGSPAPHHNGATSGGAVDISAAVAAARARAEAVKARLAAVQQGGVSQAASSAAPSAAPSSPSPGPAMSQSAQDRIAAMKARIAAASGKSALAGPPQRTASPAVPAYQRPTYDEGPIRARGGLDVGLHPALMGDAGKDSSRGQGMQSRFSTTLGNRRTDSATPSAQAKLKNRLDLSGPSLEEIQKNPYYDASLGAGSAIGKARKSRQLAFNEQGKYIAQAQALRRQANLEAMKKKIAESARKAGIDEDMDVERAFLVEPPPDIEWWDEGIVNGKDYSNIGAPDGLKLDVLDSYVQHPIQLQPPQDKHAPAPKPLPLTAHEQAKKRRQERAANMKEQQAKIRLGLEPAPPPKVKLGNMMRVLGEEAVKDPTAVEARVTREIAERKQNHEDTNEDRKLTKEQRHEKLARQQQGDADRGIRATVYKIDNLTNGRHRFKISKNAEQMALTGICILNPKFCLVIVEGGQKSVSDYKKLLLNRVKWTENDAPNREVREGNNQAMAEWLNAEDEKGQLRDLSTNRCRLIWEGEVNHRTFRKWGSRVCETDKDAREHLKKVKMDTFWTMAKGWPDDAP